MQGLYSVLHYDRQPVMSNTNQLSDVSRRHDARFKYAGFLLSNIFVPLNGTLEDCEENLS